MKNRKNPSQRYDWGLSKYPSRTHYPELQMSIQSKDCIGEKTSYHTIEKKTVTIFRYHSSFNISCNLHCRDVLRIEM